jgi:rhodanese-related sulfurtransferase
MDIGGPPWRIIQLVAGKGAASGIGSCRRLPSRRALFMLEPMSDRARLGLLLVASLLGCSSGPEGMRGDARGALDVHGSSEGPSHDRASSREAQVLAPDLATDAPAYLHDDVSVQTVQAWMTAGQAMTLVDVREATEFQGGHLSGAINLPWTSGVLKQSTGAISTSKPTVVYCASGGRSHSAATYLAAQGFRPVHDVQGGVAAWQAAGFPIVK